MHKVIVWKERDPDSRFFRMWRGRCTSCQKYTQFWFWGATLGFMLQHQYHGCNNGKTRKT